MTSNIGAGLIKRNTSLGFNVDRDEAAEEQSAYDKMREKLLERLKREFRPEFLNRVDGVVVFRALNKEDISQIVDLEIGKVNQRLLEQGLGLQLTDAGREILANEGFSSDYGARPLRRIIQNLVEDRLSDDLLAGEFHPGDIIVVDAEKGGIKLRKADEELEEPDGIVAEAAA